MIAGNWPQGYNMRGQRGLIASLSQLQNSPYNNFNFSSKQILKILYYNSCNLKLTIKY